MHAIDTNILVRFLTGDHPEQSQQARAFLDSHDVFVSTTILLESEWVLRSVYGFSVATICNALQAFAGLPRVTVESPGLLAQALEMAKGGMDFADALHCAAAAHCEAMVTFDRRFIKSAEGLSLNVRVP